MRYIILIIVIGGIIWFSHASRDEWKRPVDQERTVSKTGPCTSKDINITSWRTTIVDECVARSCAYIKIVGEAINQCPHATGVRIRITARDKDGGIVDTAERPLANVRNIPPGPYRIDLSDPFDYQKDMVTFELDVVEARQWK